MDLLKLKNLKLYIISSHSSIFNCICLKTSADFHFKCIHYDTYFVGDYNSDDELIGSDDDVNDNEGDDIVDEYDTNSDDEEFSQNTQYPHGRYILLFATIIILVILIILFSFLFFYNH